MSPSRFETVPRQPDLKGTTKHADLYSETRLINKQKNAHHPAPLTHLITTGERYYNTVI